MKLLNVYVLGLIIFQRINYMFWVGIEKVKAVDSLLYHYIPLLRKGSFFAYIVHLSYDSIMFKIAQNKAWNLTRINNAAGAFQNNTFFMFQNNTLVSRALDYSLFDYAPLHTHTHTARIRENVHIVKGNIINERKNET